MRVCGRCGYENPGPLAYCFRCGRRLGQAGPGSNVPAGTQGQVSARSAPADAGQTPGDTTAFAATVVLAEAASARGSENGTGPAAGQAAGGPLRSGWHAVAYVFAYVRGRIHVEDRKRRVAGERRGAERLIEAALAELGAAAIGTPTLVPELGDAAAAVTRARRRRESAVADLANAEKLQAAEDLHLGLEQAATESEWKACTRGADELDRMLRQLEDERRELETAGSRSAAAGSATTADARALEQKLAGVAEQFSALRERAAALRASTTAARAKLDHATAARRTAASAMAAGIAAQTRARAEAERAVADAIADAGRRALQLRLPAPDLVPRYARIDRLQQTIADNDRAVGNLDSHLGGYDNGKLATGSVVLVTLLALVGGLVWALVR